MWIPLSAASPKNGGLEYLPGSHRTLPHGLDLRPDNVSIAQEILEKLPTTNYTPVIMNPGQMALHHSRMVHASGPNRGPNERIAVAIRYETKTHSPGAPIHTPTIKLKTGNYQVSWRIVGK